MYEDLRKEAEKKVQAKMAFYICAIVFALTSVVLMMMSFYLPAVGFWLVLPIPVFIMVLGIIYITAFGLPTGKSSSQDWKEEEIDKEMRRLYRQKKLQQSPMNNLTKAEKLELKELERAEKAWREEDYV